jgi:hypothetical protein
VCLCSAKRCVRLCSLGVLVERYSFIEPVADVGGFE